MCRPIVTCCNQARMDTERAETTPLNEHQACGQMLTEEGVSN